MNADLEQREGHGKLRNGHGKSMEKAWKKMCILCGNPVFLYNAAASC